MDTPALSDLNYFRYLIGFRSPEQACSSCQAINPQAPTSYKSKERVSNVHIVSSYSGMSCVLLTIICPTVDRGRHGSAVRLPFSLLDFHGPIRATSYLTASVHLDLCVMYVEL